MKAMNMKAARLLAGLSMIAGLMGCSTALINSDYDREFNFAGHQTFAWSAQAQTSDSGYSAIHSLSRKRIQNAVERELAAKGFQKQISATSDFFVAYSVQFEDKVKVFSRGYNDWPAYYGSWWPSYYGFGLGYWPGHYNFAFSPRYFYWPGFYGAQEPVLREYKQVTLTLDILNPETAELIWRGWYVDEVEDANLAEEKINEAVKRLLEKFPPLQNNADHVSESIT